MSSSPRGKRKEKALSAALFSLSGILPNFFFSFSIYLASLGLSCGMKDPVPR